MSNIKKRCYHPKREQTRCNCAWHFWFHHRNREWRYSLDKIANLRNLPKPRTRTDALALADTLKGEIRNGKDPGAPPPPVAPATDLTFGDICDLYLADQVYAPTRRPRAIKEIEYQINAWRRAEVPAAHGATIQLQDKPLDAITTADVEHVRTSRRADARQATVAWDAYHAARDRGDGVTPPTLPHPSAKGGEVGTNRLLARLSTAFRNYGDVFSRSGSRPCRLRSTGEFREQVVKFSAGKRPAERSRNRLIAALKG